MAPLFKKKRGIKPIVKLDDPSNLVSSHGKGHVMTVQQIQKKLYQQQLLCVEKGDIATGTMNEVSKKTAKNYKLLVSNSSTAKSIQQVSHKSGTRHTIENSLMYTVCYLIVVVFSHFFVGNINPLYHRCKLRDATLCRKRFARLVSWYHNSASVYPVLPSLVIFTDDTTVFDFRDVNTKCEK